METHEHQQTQPEQTKRNIIISCGLGTIENINIALSALCYGYAKKGFYFNYNIQIFRKIIVWP